VPRQLNVKILRGKTYKHLNSIKSSKGIGEPPFFLGASVFFALREAVKAARAQNGLVDPLVGLKSPCTPETLRLACGDELVQKATVLPTNESDKPWSVRLI
jgi:xanthine dehydrogenase/oxidase